MVDLARGANAQIDASLTNVAIAGAKQGEVDLMVFQLDAGGKVRNDADFIFFNNPVSPEGGVKLLAADRISIDLQAVPPEVATLSIAVALDDNVAGSLATIVDLGVTIDQPSGMSLGAKTVGLTTERAAVLLEVYRRDSAWKVRNVSAGWDGGLADLATEHGVDVSDAEVSSVDVSDAEVSSVDVSDAGSGSADVSDAEVDGSGVRSVPDERKLSLEKRQVLDLRKRAVAKVLLDKGAQGVRARVILVIDKTGSMRGQYKSKAINRVVERMVAVATQIDDDGKLEPYLYAQRFARLPDIAVHEIEGWTETFLHLGGVHGGIDYKKIGGFNDELPIMNEIISTLAPGSPTPTLVLFFTDGGFQQRDKISNLMRQASKLPAFWQFVGIGRANYGLLERLDTLDGRAVDNAGFFALDDVDRIDDAELYRRLLGEFPDWLRAARVAQILP